MTHCPRNEFAYALMALFLSVGGTRRRFRALAAFSSTYGVSWRKGSEETELTLLAISQVLPHSYDPTIQNDLVGTFSLSEEGCMKESLLGIRIPMSSVFSLGVM